MSHFTVAVFTKGGVDEVDGLLARYDEHVEVPPYIRFTKEELIQNERERLQYIYDGSYTMWKENPAQYEKDCGYPEHIKFLRELPQRLCQSDEEIYHNITERYEKNDFSPEGGLLSTRNPDAKWDWYLIGGRWLGEMKLKPNRTGYSGDPGLMTDSAGGYDSALAGDVDFDLTKDLFPTYAVITPDGEWHAPGEIGWWCITTATDDEDRIWESEYFDRFITPAIENGWYITIVDCHI